MACGRLVSLLRCASLRRYFSSRGHDETIMNVFDRKAKRRQKNRAAMAEDVAVYDYLRDEVRICFLFWCLLSLWEQLRLRSHFGARALVPEH